MRDMYIHSSRSRVGTNFYHHFGKSGQVEIKDGKNRFTYYIEGGEIAGYDQHTNGRKIRELRYGKTLKEWTDGRLTRNDEIKEGTICSIVPKVHFEDIPAKLYGQAGTLTLKKYGGSLRGEKFTYKGRVKNKIAYELKRGTKAAEAGLTVYAPDGRIYAKYTGKINFSWRRHGAVLLNHKTKDGSSWDKIQGSEFVDFEQIDRLFDSRNYAVEVYDHAFKLKLSGRVEAGQKVDKWIVNYNEVYFIQGVEISGKLYNAKPEDLDPAEVLQINNAQVRAAFIKKIGFERIVQKIGGKVIATDPRGYELIEIPCLAVKVNQWDREPDKVIRLLKVKCPSTGAYYTLRVPPTMFDCEQARQWTFGVNNPPPAADQEAIKQYIDLQQET